MTTAQLQSLQEQLEIQKNELAFSKLSLEDEMEKVEMGVQIIRKLRDETEQLNTEKLRWQADKEFIQLLKTKIETLEAENKDLKRTVQEAQAQSVSFQIEKKAQDGMIDILRLQVQQSSIEAQKFQDIIQQSTESVPENPDDSQKEIELPSSRKKSQLLLDKTKTNLDQCLEEIGLTPTNNMKFNAKLADYHRAIQNHTQVLTQEIENAKTAIDQFKNQLCQERENGIMLLEAMESLQEQITRLSSQESKVIELSVLVPEVKIKLGSETNEEKLETQPALQTL